MAYDEKVLLCIGNYNLQLLLTTQLQKLNPNHQIVCGFYICIQAGRYEESLNHMNKQQLIYV